MNSCAWALGRALQYAAATAVVALVAATLVTGVPAERFATTAYLAAIFAALVLVAKWFLPGLSSDVSERAPGAVFPAVFTFAIGVAALLIAGAAFVSQPGAEVFAVAACFGLIGVAALVRGGAILALNAKLAQGDRLSAASRYAVAAAVAALGASALLSSLDTEGLAKLAYAAMVVATVAVAASLLAKTRAGAFARKVYAEATRLLQTPASAFVFSRTAEYAIATTVAALILASLLPQPYAERCATTAYIASLFTVLGVGMKWRLREIAMGNGGTENRTLPQRFKFGAGVAAFVAFGSALAFSSLAEMLAVCACLYLIGAVIAKRAGATPNL